jgi:hypothetical protein
MATYNEEWDELERLMAETREALDRAWKRRNEMSAKELQARITNLNTALEEMTKLRNDMWAESEKRG